MSLKPPIPPMEAQSVDAIPAGPEWQYEAKWDGFRCLVFLDGQNVMRRPKLEAFAKKNFTKDNGIRLSPATTRLADATSWLKQVGATLDGIIAKRRGAPYSAGTRDAMVKVKNYRSADCVVGGFRYGTN